MEAKLERLKQAVIESSEQPNFIHHPWFVVYHLGIVEQIACELAEHYPKADKDIVRVMVWLHDYGKMIDFADQYQQTLAAGKERLLELGFADGFVERVISLCEVFDRKLEQDLRKAPIEVQIVASADGCSHLVGPFMALWWWENPTKDFKDLMADNRRKLQKDWDHKIVLPEARTAFVGRYRVAVEQTGELPRRYIP